jgi:hypothetical protein
MTLTSGQKISSAGAALVLLAATAHASQWTAVAGARAALVVAALAAGIAWLRRRPSLSASAAQASRPRLAIAARAGLSARCGVALLEADGQTYLVAYGDGFAQLLHSPAVQHPCVIREERP